MQRSESGGESACLTRRDLLPSCIRSPTMTLETAAPSVETTAIINSLNRLELLRGALTALTAALRQAPELKAAVVVYEAGSTDGSREFLETWQREHPEDRLEIVTPAPGAGTTFSDGVNDGCRAALQRFPGTRFLLLYETDNWIAGPLPLLQAREVLLVQPELAAAGWTSRRHTGQNTGYAMRFPRLLALVAGGPLTMRFGLEFPEKTTVQRTPGGVEWWRCDIAFTSPLLIRREAWEGTGGLDVAAFPFADCDLDWAWRCREMGFGGPAIVRSDAVVHDNRGQASAWSADRLLRLQRARMVLLKRHRGAWRVNAVKPLLFLRHVIESVLLRRAKRRGEPDAASRLKTRLGMLGSVWRDYRD